MPKDTVLDDRFTIHSPFLLALAGTTCVEEAVTVAVVGDEAVSGVLVLTVPDIVADEPMPGFCDTVYNDSLNALIISNFS